MEKFVVTILLFAAVFAHANFSDDQIGYDLEEFVYPIFKKRKVECLGTLVGKTSKKVIIATSAHCVDNSPASELAVQIDPKGGNNVGVDTVIVHPFFSPSSFDYDIALVKAAGVKSVSPWNISSIEPASSVQAIRWTPKEKKFDIINATLENRASCKGKLAGHLTVTRKMLCVNVEGSLPYLGPILFDGNLAGVASFAVRNANANLPKVYTNIANSEISSFIEKYL